MKGTHIEDAVFSTKILKGKKYVSDASTGIYWTVYSDCNIWNLVRNIFLFTLFIACLCLMHRL